MHWVRLWAKSLCAFHLHTTSKSVIILNLHTDSGYSLAQGHAILSVKWGQYPPPQGNYKNGNVLI